MTTETAVQSSVTPSTAKKSPTRHLVTVGRFLLGLPLLVFGLNSFLNFIPPSKTAMPAGAAEFAGALMHTGYMMPLIGLTHLVCGLMLVTNRFVPLALVILAPFFLNSVLFHIFLERTGLPMALIFTALELALAWAYRRAYAPLLTAKFS